MRPIIIFILFCFLIPLENFATHLRSGEITAERISCLSLRFRITITVFLDTESGVTFGGEDDWLDFGDGKRVLIPVQSTIPRPDLGKNMGMVIFPLEHTYSGYQQYKITYSEPFRNEFIANMDRSVATRFLLETVIYLDPALFCNQNLPDLLIPPIDRACRGVTFFHNPGAVDLDGDSLSFEMAIPQQRLNTPVFNYKDPNDKKFYTNYDTGNEDQDGPPLFSIDARDGTLKWDAPGLLGEYNIAFRIVEWRKDQEGVWRKMSYVTRDMQVIVEDCDNERPDLILPSDTCVVAGTILKKTIFGIDPENDNVKIEAFSEVLNLFVSPASYSPFPAQFQPSLPPAQLHFRWKTECAHVKDQFYQVVFKITDNPAQGPKLVTFKTWRIKVVAPPPQWSDISLGSGKRSALLTWYDYACSNADKMQIWRKIDGSAYTPANCETGMPDYLGYSLIATVALNNAAVNSFTDHNKGEGLAPGATYCYRLVALFPMPSGGESYVSKDTCLTIEAHAPVITHVTVEETDVTQGAIRISWRSPFGLDQTQYPGPYEYAVYRATGFAGADAVMVTPIDRIRDTTFVDMNLNTEDEPFNYKIILYSNTASEPLSWNAIDTSATASSVRLETISSDKAITLHWKAEVPWSNISEKFPYHLVYRKEGNNTVNNFILIASVVSENGFEYIDQNIPSGEETYCYKVVTRGVYGNPLINEPFENSSQIMCSRLNDPPRSCIPVLAIDQADCNEGSGSAGCLATYFNNRIYWTPISCTKKPKSYRVYAASGPEQEFLLLADNVTDTLYVDKNLSSLARCYSVSAIDNQGNESEWSEMVCNDNCPYFELPNVFSPNGDRCNDYFSAYGPFNPLNQDASETCVLGSDNFSKCTRFVKDVSFRVFNRWGREVYTYKSGTGESSIYINWDGRSNDGQWLSTGVYYYAAQVTFETLKLSSRNRSYKGYIHLIR